MLRHDKFLQEIFEGRMKGRPTRGRKGTQLLDDLADVKDYASLKREAEDKSIFAVRIYSCTVYTHVNGDSQCLSHRKQQKS